MKKQKATIGIKREHQEELKGRVALIQMAMAEAQKQSILAEHLKDGLGAFLKHHYKIDVKDPKTPWNLDIDNMVLNRGSDAQEEKKDAEDK